MLPTMGLLERLWSLSGPIIGSPKDKSAHHRNRFEAHTPDDIARNALLHGTIRKQPTAS